MDYFKLFTLVNIVKVNLKEHYERKVNWPSYSDENLKTVESTLKEIKALF